MFLEAAQNCPLILIIGKQTGYTKKTAFELCPENYAVRFQETWGKKWIFHPAFKPNIWPTQMFQIKTSLNYARIFSIFQCKNNKAVGF